MTYLIDLKRLKKKQKSLDNYQLTAHIMRLAEKHGKDPMEIFLKLEVGKK